MIRAWSGVIALICILGLGCSSSWAFDLPKPKKDSKKDDTNKEDPNAAYAAESEETLKIVEPLIEKALSAYNKDDSKTFYADYAKSMAGIATDQSFKALYGGYKDQFGNYVSKKIVKARCSLKKTTPGLVSYDAEFEKNKAVRIDVNYLPEDGVLKLMQVQFNAAAGGQPAANRNKGPAAPAAGAAMDVKMPKSIWDKVNGNYKAGDFVEQEYPSNPGLKIRKEVLEAGDHFIVVNTKMTMNGATTETKAKWVFTEPDPEKVQGDKKVETKEAPDTVKIAGKELAATRYESYIDGALTGKSWMCKDIPIDGIAKCEGADGKTTLLTVDFGRGK